MKNAVGIAGRVFFVSRFLRVLNRSERHPFSNALDLICAPHENCGFQDMDQHSHHLVRSIFGPDTKADRESCWRPSVDVYRGGDAWLVKLDPAGVRADGVQLEVQGNRLHVSGHRSDLSIFDQQQACSMEISYNRFHRSVELPIDLSHVNMCREYHDGMLLVVIEQKNAE